MKKPPCAKDCEKRHPACHDNCKEYLEWKEYVRDTKHKLNLEKVSYRSKASDDKRRKDRKRYGAKYMKNKF